MASQENPFWRVSKIRDIRSFHRPGATVFTFALSLLMLKGAVMLDDPVSMLRPSNFPIQVYIDSSRTSSGDTSVVVPESARQIRFRVDAPGEKRVRFLLEGVEQTWTERPGFVSFTVRFLDKDDDVIEQPIFMDSGTSPGWNRSLETSTFTPRSESVTVPPGAVHAVVVVSSAGSPAELGVFSITNLTVSRLAADGSPAETIVSSAPFLEQNGQTSPGQKWRKGGTHPSMAQITTIPGPHGPFRALTIIDTDVNGHADWTSPDLSDQHLVAGEKLQVRWEEAFNVSMGNEFSAYYGALHAGTYRFRVVEEDVNGLPLRHEYSTLVTVPLPYWRNPWFWGMVLAAMLILGILVGRYVVRANVHRELNRARLIDAERMRIARDLHDDLGTRLSQICLATSYAQQTATGENRENFRSINTQAQEVMTSLTEAIWMLNPKNDNLESLVDMLCRLVPALCKTSDIGCRIDAEPMPENVSLTNEFRHHVSLTVREAVSNALRHSGLTEISLRIRFEASVLKISISDNGRGLAAYDATSAFGGNGLGNMQQRMQSLNGHFAIESPPEGGARVFLEIPVKPSILTVAP